MRGLRNWHRFRVVLIVWGALLAINGIVGIAAHVVDVSSPAVVAGMTLVMIVVVLTACWVDRKEIIPLLRRSGFTDDTWWMPFAAIFGMWAFMTGYVSLVSLLGVEPQSYLEDYREHGWPLWSAFLIISVCPGLFEELAFRGVILGRLQELMKERDALIVQAAMFSVLHMSPLIFISHFVMGLVFGVLRSKTGSLWPGVITHMGWNAWVIFSEAVS